MFNLTKASKGPVEALSSLYTINQKAESRLESELHKLLSKKQGKQDVKGSTYTERNNMNSSTNSYGSAGNLSIDTSYSYLNFLGLLKSLSCTKIKSVLHFVHKIIFHRKRDKKLNNATRILIK